MMSFVEHEQNWWKRAASSDEDKVFRKLMDQFETREDKARHMGTMLAEGKAPSWFTDRLADQLIHNPYDQTPEWAVPWVIAQISQHEGSAMQRAARSRLFHQDMVEGGTVPNWGRVWANEIELDPDRVPPWFDGDMLDFIYSFGEPPYWADNWAHAKLSRGRQDAVAEALEWTVRKDAEKGIYNVPHWGRDWAAEEGLI